MMKYWSAGVVDRESGKKLSLYSSPSLCELVLNEVKEDKFTHHSTVPIFSRNLAGWSPSSLRVNSAELSLDEEKKYSHYWLTWMR